MNVTNMVRVVQFQLIASKYYDFDWNYTILV